MFLPELSDKLSDVYMAPIGHLGLAVGNVQRVRRFFRRHCALGMNHDTFVTLQNTIIFLDIYFVNIYINI